MGLESAQAWSLGARLPAAAAGFCGAQRPNGSSQEALPSAWLAWGRLVGGGKRERERETAAAAERRAERARGERPCPAPGVFSPPSRPGSLAPSSLPFLPGPASSLDSPAG